MSICAYLLGVNSISCSIDKTVLQELVHRKKVINDFIDGTQKFRGDQIMPMALVFMNKLMFVMKYVDFST